MDLKRFFRHLLMPPWRLRQLFPAGGFAAVEHAIAASEARHGGEIRFAIEDTLAPVELWRGLTARERAIEVFSELRVWDTEYNSGVLIYLLLADRDVEIVADRGVAAKVGKPEWEAICRRMEKAFRHGDFVAGVLQGIEAATSLLAIHFPPHGGQRDELPNRPIEL